MNSTQTRYIRDRIERLKYSKTNQMEDNFRVISLKKKYDLIKQGKVKLLPFEEVEDYGHGRILEKCFDFSKFDKDEIKGREELKKAKNEVIKKLEDVEDQIMLGDSKKALDLIKYIETL